MKTVMKIAFRNLVRQKRRSYVTGGAAAVGVFGILLYISVMNGMLQKTIDSALDVRVPPVVVEKSVEGSYQPFRITDQTWQEIISLPGVDGASGRLVRDALVTSASYSVAGGTRGLRIHGVDPRKEKGVSSVDRLMEEGSGQWLSAKHRSNKPQIVVGYELAEKMDLQPGNSLVMTIVQPAHEQQKSEQDARILVRVAGVYRSANKTFEERNAYVHREMILERLAGMEPEHFHLLAIRTPGEDAMMVKKEVSRILENRELQIKTWKEQDPFLASNIEVFDYMNYIFLVIVLMAALFILINTMLMVVQERFREFGVLKALGTSPSYVALLIVVEGLLLGMLGTIAGTALSAPVVFFFHMVGLNLGLFAEGLRSLGVPVELQTFWKVKDLIVTAGSMFVFSLLGSLYPAVRAARIRILDAIHFT